jgi:glycosyltransferase involved in cell wall biosynthesis
MAALAHGLPIVSTWPRVAVPELIHEENVWLVLPGDAAALAEAVRRLGAAADRRKRLAAGARALAQEFCWQPIAARTLEVYREVVHR